MPDTSWNCFTYRFLIAISALRCVDAICSTPDSCRVFCGGNLLETIQQSHLYADSKYFVDMPLKNDVETTLTAFNQLENKEDLHVLHEFVTEYFMEAGAELRECQQSDWVPNPPSLEAIQCPIYRKWALEIHNKWKTLCRQVKLDVRDNPDRYSLIYVPHPFVIPGGRFRELYYWDTYWIIKGLMASGMYNSSKLMILNLAHMVKRFGFVPNGGRIYYLNRSQPPFLCGSVYEYYQATNDTEFVQEMLPIMETELSFWYKKRSVNWTMPDGTVRKLYRYTVNATAPRPESFKEDIETAHLDCSDETKRQIWSDIAAACESGWDFSSRWFHRNGTNHKTLRGIRTERVIPVDLNSFMCWNENIMAELYDLVGNETLAEEHREKHLEMRDSMHKLFWSEKNSTWFDLDLFNKRQYTDYYTSNLTPLFVDCTHDQLNLREMVLQYLKNVSAFLPGGLPTSLSVSGEQWDRPNGWAPAMHMIVEGFRKSPRMEPQEAAYRLAESWIHSNYLAYMRSGGKLFEKYNVEKFIAKAGGGGEYDVQEGFGWTNGVLLDLLVRYGDRLRAAEIPPDMIPS